MRGRGEQEAGERPRHSRLLLAGRGTAPPSRSRRGHRLAARSHGSKRRRRLAARDWLSFERAVLPVASSRGAAARGAGAAGTLSRSGVAATPAGRGTAGPSRSSAHGADCLIVTAVSQYRIDHSTASGRTGQTVTAITISPPGVILPAVTISDLGAVNSFSNSCYRMPRIDFHVITAGSIR